MSEGTGKKSVADYFRGNKIGITVVGATLVVVSALALVAHKKATETPPSSIAPPPQVNSVAGQQATPQYNRDVAQMNARQAEIAQMRGQSFIPTPIGNASNAYSGEQIHPMLGVSAPTKPSTNTNAEQLHLAQPVVQSQPVQLSMANPPQAYLDEVKAVLGAIAPVAPQIVPVATAQKDAVAQSRSPERTGAPQPASAPATGSVKPKFPANIDPVQFAVAQISVSSDTPGPVLLRIPQGPLRGATLIGSFQREGRELSIRLTSMQWAGTNWSTDAVAIDPNTSLPAVRSAVDDHTISRYASLLGGAFLGALQGYGQAIAQSGQTTVQTLGNSATVTTNPQMSAHQALIIAGATAAGTAAQTAGQVISQGWNQPPTVTLQAGTGVGVLFLSTPKPAESP